jgi:TolA-binding protein
VSVVRGVLFAFLIGAAGAPVAAVAQAGSTASPPLSVADAKQRVEESNRRLDEIEARLEQLEAERTQIDDQHANLTTQQAELARQLEIAKRDLRQLAVTAYIAGGPAGDSSRLLEARQFNDSVWQAALIEGQADRTVASARRYQELLDGADAAVRDLVQRVDQNRAKVEQATFDHFLASVEDKAAEQELIRAKAREAIGSARALAPSLDDAGGADAWARLRNCESGGNYQAISPSGKYRGAYQFDLRTWESVGGSGDPIDASPEEQDLRARILYSRSGSRPWPVCGRYLP